MQKQTSFVTNSYILGLKTFHRRLHISFSNSYNFYIYTAISLQITLEMKVCMKSQVFWVVTLCHWACSSWRFTTHIINICTIHSIYPRQSHPMKYCTHARACARTHTHTHTHTQYHWPFTNKWHTHFTASWDILQGSNFRTCIILSNQSQARVPVQIDST